MIRAVIFAIATLAVTATLPAKASCPVADALIAQYGISFSGFTHSLPRVPMPDERQSRPDDLVTLVLPNRHGNVSDGFSHSALINKDKKRAWILRTGGFVSVYEWYGPIALPVSDFSGCVTEPGRLPQQTSAKR